MTAKLRAVAHRLLPLLDLTPQDARHRRAGTVASVVVAGGGVAPAVFALAGSGIGVGAVVAVSEIAAALADGAREIELVMPDEAAIRAARILCGRQARLTVVLEAGRLTPAAIHHAAMTSIACGADALSTATEGSQPGATLDAAEIILRAIETARQQRRWIGFKACGGIANLSDAMPYLALYDRRFGDGAAGVATFRIGGGVTLLDNILAVLGLSS